MKTAVLSVVIVLGAAPAFAQFGIPGEIRRRADQAQRVAELNISEKEERELGERVSAAVRSEFGVLQDAALTKYVATLGSLMAKASPRPDLKWEFVVLDTEGVNAFAAPGGLVHITKGALGLIRNEAELAGVLGHEIAHITGKHSVNAIRNNKGLRLLTEEAGSRTSYWYTQIADAIYDNIVENRFSRSDENEADREGARMADKAGYAASGLGSFLQKLMDRNKGKKGDAPNGLFATHPETSDRIARLAKQIAAEKLAAAALGEARYAEHVTFAARPATEIVLADDSKARGVAGAEGSAGKEASTEPKKEEKKSGGMFGGLRSRLSGSPQKESTQASASGGGRAVDPNRPDRFARGGDNPNKVPASPTTAEIDTFRKGIA
jgi:predicted Zn-dependent protease